VKSGADRERAGAHLPGRLPGGRCRRDTAAGSWILAPLINSEHPPAPEIYGEWVAANVLNTLVSNPNVWSKTALFITHDENNGFFDHVPPATALAGTPGESLPSTRSPRTRAGWPGRSDSASGCR